MKKTVICLSMLVALIATPALVSAELLPGLPSLPGTSAFNMPTNLTLGKLSLYGGWATNAGMTNFTVSRTAPGIFPITDVEWDYAYNSFYMAATLPVSLRDYGALLLSGSWAIPNSSPCRETAYLAGVMVSQGIWSVDTSWTTAEGAWAYPLSDTFTALAGFRWESWQLSYKSLDLEFGGFHAPLDTGDATYNAYLPYVGLVATYRGLNVGVIGFPTTFGDVKQFEQWGAPFNVEVTAPVGGGYYLEIFGDCALPMPGSLRGLVAGQEVDLSLFGKASFLETGGTATFRWNLLGLSEEWDFSLRRNVFLVGAKATWNFNWSNLLPI